MDPRLTLLDLETHTDEQTSMTEGLSTRGTTLRRSRPDPPSHLTLPRRFSDSNTSFFEYQMSLHIPDITHTSGSPNVCTRIHNDKRKVRFNESEINFRVLHLIIHKHFTETPILRDPILPFVFNENDYNHF